MNMAALPILWANCVDLLKDRVNNRSFWQALEASRAITIDGGVLVIGLADADYSRVSYLEQSSNMNAINRAVQERFNADLRVRVIEGTTIADWEQVKIRDQRIAAMKQQAPLAPSTANIPRANSWDTLSEAIAQLYQATDNRLLPQGKARYANDALYAVAEAMDMLYPENPDEAAERNLARALERIAGHADIPAPVLAFELERLVAWRRAEQPTEEA